MKLTNIKKEESSKNTMSIRAEVFSKLEMAIIVGISVAVSVILFVFYSMGK